jgi:hypothetical protein
MQAKRLTPGLLSTTIAAHVHRLIPLQWAHTSSITTNRLNALIPSNVLETANRLLGLGQRLAIWVQERRTQGFYDLLSLRRTVTMHDPEGRVVTVDTVQQVRFRQNQVAVLLDYVWGDGDILREYTCSPGVPVDCYKEGTRHVVLISLRELKSRGDELSFTTHRQVIGGGTRPSECWESEVYHRTRRMEVRLLFPPERRCQRAAVTVQSTGQTTALGKDNWSYLPDGQQELVWVCLKPRLNECYLLRWEW